MIEKSIDFIYGVPLKLASGLFLFMNMTMIVWIAMLPIALFITTGNSWFMLLVLSPYAISSAINNFYVFETGDDEDDRWVLLSNASDSTHFIIEAVMLIILGGK